MELIKQPTIKKALLLFGLPVVGSAAGNAVYEHLITPAIPFLPKVPFILYSIFATAFAVLFLLGLVAASGQLLAKGWRHLTTKDLRNDLVEDIRAWPTGKWDLLPVIATTYFVATMLPLVAALLVLPEGQLAGVVSQEQFGEHVLNNVYSNDGHFRRLDGASGVRSLQGNKAAMGVWNTQRENHPSRHPWLSS